MKKEHIVFILRVLIYTIAIVYVGGIFGFFPFLSDDLIVNEIMFCTVVICGVLAVCTCVILSKMEK